MPSDETFRHELRSWLAEHAPPAIAVATTAEEAEVLREWQRILHAGGWVGIHWPVEYGGRGASATQVAIYNEELARAKKKLIGQQEIANQSNEAFGYQCALEEIYGLGFDYYKRLEHDVDAVTLDDIKRVAAKYFRDQPYVLATVRPPEGSAAAKQK